MEFIRGIGSQTNYGTSTNQEIVAGYGYNGDMISAIELSNNRVFIVYKNF